ncbi:MAG: hypothetical protein ABSF69_13035 [Polyangiaceae bacterium]|jgi:hypothetical protein
MAPTTTSTPKPVNKSDFIRAQAAAMSAAEIVDKAKAQGIDLRPGLVYEVRRTAKAVKAVAPKKRATPAKKTSTAAIATTKPAIGSKAAFVRSHANLSPSEIVGRAKAAGIRLEVGYVYNIRSADKTAAAKTKAPAKRPSLKVVAPTAIRPGSTTASPEDLLKVVAAEIGLGRAIELLLGDRARVHAILRGPTPPSR